MPDFEHMSKAGKAAAMRALRRQAQARQNEPHADFRAESEDDDGYDPYSDYMDAQARCSTEEPEEDLWR